MLRRWSSQDAISYSISDTQFDPIGVTVTNPVSNNMADQLPLKQS